MKTLSLSNLTKTFAVALVAAFTACTEANDPVPTTPNTSGIPTDAGTPTTPFTPTTPAQPDNNSTLVGRMASGESTFDYTEFIGGGETQADENGKYPIVLGYADQTAMADGELSWFDQGSSAIFIYNANQPGTIVPGTYEYNSYSGMIAPFYIAYFAVNNTGYRLTEGSIQVDATEENGIYLITVKGDMVQIDENYEIVSEEIPVEAQFLSPAQVEVSSSASARVDSNPVQGQMPTIQ
ncbi:hypothetical protein [Tunicatimonas pelagia]|uniref:hypothetical protein n=1 Tax=Tunicatimonas pelagia TaxID=931531 RepID=UPI0026671E7A|nr:hypothetical protein [Tunicatimonas pelagia]WKN41557.1 hypothetical protein P0M28_21210 [Tunicatimonas pelagia]